MADLITKIKNHIKKIDPELLDIIKRGNIFPDLLREYIIHEITNSIFLKQDLCDSEFRNHLVTNRITKNDLKKILTNKGIREEDYQEQVLMEFKKYIFSEKQFKNELEKYFLKRKENLDEYIFNIIRLKNKDLAHELFFRLEEGESNFNFLAKKYAIYSDLYPEGIYGPVTIKGFHPTIKEKLIASSEGELLQPFQADDWWIIIKLIEKKEAQLNHETRKILMSEMFDIFVDKITKEILEDHANGFF